MTVMFEYVQSHKNQNMKNILKGQIFNISYVAYCKKMTLMPHQILRRHVKLKYYFSDQC